ncbi:aldehyde dehydrogenase family protein [Pseudenhygromyxa sp. WMMC2535]|uniref:aldehyde dehydrogenase family protein n=1 Tax=Pseudenhygromyxa sp. WMMC2535 TaxID=2712867 RepID=UPI001551EDB2|nr:aldehyde dehydrogenase family protein [Pseudenhygromyxa sp. WMMC2535]NVB36738.1 aldehyde dehydrogenase family protein [Pseudenhygromyxa sp. WMMC2535]
MSTSKTPPEPGREQARHELKLAGALELAPALESTPVEIRDHYGHYIAGAWVEGAEEARFETLNPATGARLASVAAATEAEVDAAVSAARTAYEQVWSKLSGLERGKYLFRIARRLQERAREFAVLETIDNGKPIRETRDIDVPLAAAHFFYYAGWADKLGHAAAGRSVAPLGVAAQIIPWNFPLLMLAWKIAPALATGNTVVLKPAETTPLTAALFCEVLDAAGLPPGVVNIINGAGPTGARLVAHPGVDKVAFTGSTAVGRTIMQAIAGTQKRATMELGGKGANIVFADAALDQAVEGCVDGIFFNQGHVCCAGSRLLVEESIAEDFVARLQRRVQTLRVGDPLDKNTDIGAINSKQQHETIAGYLEIATREGATVWQGAACEPPAAGHYHLPTILTGVQQTDTVVREEIFGPVLSVLTFRTPDEAVRKANDTEYGLACGVWSEKSQKLFRTAHALDCGVVWANGYNLFDPTSPFGGVRHSGFGREGGVAGLWPYLREVSP